jgi:lysozyme family protein
MPLTNDEIIDIVLKFEGGYRDKPESDGGPTNFGISAADYGRWLGQAEPATPDQMRAMEAGTAREIYRKWYIDDPGFDSVPDDALRLVLVDSSVLVGPSWTVMWLQQMIGIAADGKFGERTRAAIKSYAAPSMLPRRMLGRRIAGIANIVHNDPSQIASLRPWTKRTVSLLDYV